MIEAFYPAWAIPPMVFEISATLVLGVIATWTREIVRHFDEDSPHETSFSKCLVMVIPGVFSGFLGGEMAQMAGYNPSDFRDPSWLFVLTIGYIGPPAMNMLCQFVLGVMQKVLERWGLDFEKQQSDNMKRLEKEDLRRQEQIEREYKQAREIDEANHVAQMKELAASLNEPS